MRFAIAVRKCKKCIYENAMFNAFEFRIPHLQVLRFLPGQNGYTKSNMMVSAYA